MLWEVEHTDEFEKWWMSLTPDERESVAVAVELLERKGPALGRPWADTLSKDSKYPNMKELRVQHGGKPYRIAFAFDPRQTAILLIGGIKSGKRWSQKLVRLADRIYGEYLRQLKKEGLI